MANKKPQIQYFNDKITNDKFLTAVDYETEGYEEIARQIIADLILDYRNLVPSWDRSTAGVVLDIACMEVEKMKLTKAMSSKDKKLSRDDTTKMSAFCTQIDSRKKEIGIDAKSARSKGKGSISETFADVARYCRFDKKRFVCKTVFGLQSKVQGEDGEDNPFKDAKPEDVERYLQTAEAE